MVTLHAIWSDGILLAIVGSAVVSIVLMVVCLIAGLCPCEKENARANDPEPAARPAESVDLTWMRAA